MNRRQCLTSLLALAAVSGVNCSSINYLTKPSKNDIRNLEEIFNGSSIIPSFNKRNGLIGGCTHLHDVFPKLSNQRTPQICYMFNPEDKNERNMPKIGTVFFLNQDGFFLTAAHNFDILENQKRIMLVYEPKNKIVLNAKILAKSDKDIALGRVDKTKKLEIPTTQITSGNIADNDYFFVTSVNNIEYAVLNCFQEILKSGRLKKRIREFSYEQEKIPRIDTQNLNLDTPGIVGVKFSENGLFYLEQEVKMGQSGSPVFTLFGELAGIVTHSASIDEIGLLTKFTGPAEIRKMIRGYINKNL